MRCYHKLENGHWVPTPGEAGGHGRGGRNVDLAIARHSVGIMAGADGRSLSTREQRNLDRLDRLALRRQARADAGVPKTAAKPEAAGRRTLKPGESLGPAYDKRGRYNPARDPNLRPEQVAAARTEVRSKRERSPRRSR